MCLDAIKNLENPCWSCLRPLVPSEPIKSLEDEFDITTPISGEKSK